MLNLDIARVPEQLTVVPDPGTGRKALCAPDELSPELVFEGAPDRRPDHHDHAGGRHSQHSPQIPARSYRQCVRNPGLAGASAVHDFGEGVISSRLRLTAEQLPAISFESSARRASPAGSIAIPIAAVLAVGDAREPQIIEGAIGSGENGNIQLSLTRSVSA
jgi:hypothetical protein